MKIDPNVVKEKPECHIDPSHGVIPVRLQGTFHHFWTCLSCLDIGGKPQRLARAPDRNPDIPEKFTIGGDDT